MRSLPLLLPALALAHQGCAHAGLRFPGPLGSIGRARPDWVDEEEESVWDDIERTASGGREDEPGAAAEGAPPAARRRGEAVAAAARHYLGAGRLRAAGESYRWDCSGLVEAAHARAGLPVSGSSEDLLEQARALRVFHRRRPAVGDVAFFENTYDANGNGRLDDPVTHVAVVVAVDADGTVTLVHKGGDGITTLRLNMATPDARSDEQGKELNSYLRAQSRRDDPRTRYLAGELCLGFASFWRAVEAE